MNLETYERSGRAIYAGLAEVVAAILRAAIAQDVSLHAQQIQHRAKDLKSLERKLKKAGSGEAVDIEPYAKDLAGARIIFYTNSDVKRFQDSGIMKDNFEIDWDRTKFHYPVSENPKASELFVSNNYVVRLKSERAILPEYTPFADIWCEVQIQTTLNHAWAEMAHDTIYKKPELSGFGGKLMEGIESRMKAIMRDYLAPAGYAFQKVLNDFERLSRGQELFEKGIIAEIEKSPNNNELHETLIKFSNSVLPYYDDYRSTAIDILVAVTAAVKRARKTPVQAIETPFGNLSGKTSMDVVEIAAKIIEDLRFVNVEQTFSIICDLYLSAVDADEASRWVNLVSSLARHDMQVWEQSGPIVQLLLMARIRALSEEERSALRLIILEVFKEIFAVDVSGTTSSFDTMVVHRGTVSPSDVLRQIRSESLQYLHLYDDAVQDDLERAELVGVYKSAMTMPRSARLQDPELTTIVFDNATEIINRYADRASGWTYETRQSIEHDLLWMYRHYGVSPSAGGVNVDVEKARSGVVVAIREFRDRINADEGYTTYKLLVGFESVFPPAWDDPEFDAKEDAYREEQIDRVIAGIAVDNASKWLSIIRRCAATQSNDLATFPSFAKFLERLSIAQPGIVLSYLEELDPRSATFLSPILRGLSQTPSWPAAEEVLRVWIAEARFLSDIGWAFGSVEALSFPMLRATLSASIAAGDENAVFSIIRSISARDGPDSTPEIRQPFLDAVAFMAGRNDPRWINVWWSKGNSSALLTSLTDDETVMVLESLVGYPRVETRLEQFLVSVAKSRPQLVIDYFGKRLSKRLSNGHQSGYDAIPYGFRPLKDVLSTVPELIVKSAREWFRVNPEYFSFYGGSFIENVFPNFPESLDGILKKYINNENKDDIKFVVEILRAYEGQIFLHSICKEIIAILPDDDPLFEDVEITLEPSGALVGEFGRVKRLKEQREAITSWTGDEREAVRSFAIRYLKYLDSAIVSEQRRSEERLALRKLEYDQPESTKDGSAE